ncbi:MAG TPA: sigma-70 family RNA polymerase sigma factor [Frankiaceae bacterium]|nr:sigma-70 family RNA polymerase sigma factor [Frankiaceae bacterium]
MSAYRRFPAPDPDGLRELRGMVAFRTAPGTAAVVGAVAVPVPRLAAVVENDIAPVEEETAAPDAVVADLVERAQAGNADAFGQLYDRYVDTIFRYVYYRVGSQPLAEDLVSETFLRALRRITSFTWQGRDFGAWLVTIARNLITDYYKSSRYKLEAPTGEMLDADRTVDGPENLVLDSLTNVTLLRAVKMLGAEQQECVVLRFLQGFSVTETALAMGKTDGAIKALQYRAVQSLKKLLPAELVL